MMKQGNRVDDVASNEPTRCFVDGHNEIFDQRFENGNFGRRER